MPPSGVGPAYIRLWHVRPLRTLWKRRLRNDMKGLHGCATPGRNIMSKWGWNIGMSARTTSGFSFELPDRLVQIWTVRTDASNAAAVAGQLASILAPDERDRAARFHFDHLRVSFI